MALKIYETSGWSSSKTAKLIAALEQRNRLAKSSVSATVARIVAEVRKGSDKALLKFAKDLDGMPVDQPLRVSPAAMQAALTGLSSEMRDALETAADNIQAFAQKQMPADFDFEITPGLLTGQRVRALDSVGCYVPSGRYPLPSTLLMTVIPARVAGVKRIVVVSPKPSAETLAAAALLGVEEVYSIGGAHAVAALAYGTESIAPVNKIVGPGNKYVTAAKRMVAGDCGIDMLAGPTEIGVYSDRGDAAFIASDLVAQSEHDADALAVFITTKAGLAKDVLKEAERLAKENPTARNALAKHGYIFLAVTPEEAQNITNRLAFEHLTVDSVADLDWITSAGSVFAGNWSAQPLGDYVSGPNHTLPTGGLAHVRGGLSVLDFVKIITVQGYTQTGVRALGPAAITLAEAEGLVGHAEAVRVRLDARD
jgi:histidinol dehydrogenase